MNSLKTTHASKSGYTLIELALVIMVVAVLAAFAVVSFGNSSETRDASMVQSAQASLQSIVSQGSVRMDVRPADLNSAAVLTAIKSTVGESSSTANRGITFTAAGRVYTMTIASSKRKAVFEVDAQTGDVKLTGLTNFPNYKVDNTNAIPTITKGP